MTVQQPKAPLLKVRDLAVEFSTDAGVVRAVNGVSFDLRRGEIVAMVGESGCGKSVTALALLRLIANPPGSITGGAVLFDGQDLLKVPLPALRRIRGDRIAMIFQEPMSSLNPVHAVGRQIAEPLRLHRGMPERAALSQAVELMASVRISDPNRRRDDYPHQFSGGMQQRVMIAMGTACAPDIVIADEPTTALDVTIQAQILELLKEQVDNNHTAVLLITHNLGIVARYADRVNVMYAGRIVEQANADDIYERPRHPYTIGLLQSVPRLDQAAGDKLVPIEGQPPNPLNMPPGCPFQPRCRYAVARCQREAPVLKPVSDSQSVACWVDVNG
jgi:oligopeptide/dipeptide ABC transporter ATP-binding protein